jgi:3'-phosphoadenosine 5'-phosphosulfate (PAPS) 3'-phosphatase
LVCRGDLTLKYTEEQKHKYKSEADTLAHNAMCDGLRKIDPKIPIVSEENAVYVPVGKRYWLVDPLDGTASFIQGFNGFVTQAALVVDGKPVLSAVYAPVFNNLYYAELGKGAFVNGTRMFSSQAPAMSMVDCFPEPEGLSLEIYDRMRLLFYSECGSFGLKICRIADGTDDVLVKDVLVENWDIAAPQLILEEAGGVMTDLQGDRIRYTGEGTHNGIIVANTAATHREIVGCLQQIKRRNA